MRFLVVVHVPSILGKQCFPVCLFLADASEHIWRLQKEHLQDLERVTVSSQKLHQFGPAVAADDVLRPLVAVTAHPAKFDSIVEPLIGRQVPVPPALAALLSRPADAIPIAPTVAALAACL